MKFMATADTDIGKRANGNQDSVLIRHRESAQGEVLLCVICDGLGGLSSGELASATVVRTFADWFDREMSKDASVPDIQKTARRWGTMLNDINRTLLLYGEKKKIHLGSTFSGILFAGERYLICHVGDSRIYHIGGHTEQLTEDQTLAAREVREGRLTKRRARQDERKHILLQCVGASASVTPQIKAGQTKQGIYLLCSDGLYHETTGRELKNILRPDVMEDRRTMHDGARYLIELVKSRGETDNISVVVIRAQSDRRK